MKGLDYLTALNPAQRRAVTHSPDGGLQVLAGPGSGSYSFLRRYCAILVRRGFDIREGAADRED